MQGEHGRFTVVDMRELSDDDLELVLGGAYMPTKVGIIDIGG